MEGFRAVLEFDTVESEDDSRFPDDFNSSLDFVPEGLSQCSRAENATESNQFILVCSYAQGSRLITFSLIKVPV